MSIINFFKNTRVYVATVFLAIALTALLFGGFILTVFIGILAVLGTKELVDFTRKKGLNPSLNLIIGVEVILFILATLNKFEFIIPCLSFGIIIAFLTILFRGEKATINDVSATILAFLYGGFLPMHLILLRNIQADDLLILGKNIPAGVGFIVLMFLVITLCDVAAYYIGVNFGKTPLWKEISPKKTVEGAIAGTVASILGAVLVGQFIGLAIIHSLILGFILSLAAQFGDLTESMMKRDAGVKDSGNLLPGHGGVLDRADSYTFTGVIAYYYFSFFVLNSFILF